VKKHSSSGTIKRLSVQDDVLVRPGRRALFRPGRRALFRPGRRALFIVLALASTLSAQEPAATFRAGTTLVPIDVRVVDRDGRPVTDLQASDFSVLEDDQPQTLVHFSTQRLEAEAPGDHPASLAPAAPFELTASRRRTFLLVLGRGWLQPPSKGVDAMIHLVTSRLLPQDQVAVLAWNRATAFTTDRQPILDVLERFKREHEGLETRIALWERSMQSVFNPRDLPDDIQRDIDEVFGGARSARTMAGNLDGFLDEHATVLNDLMSLYLGVEYLRQLAGEKHLLYVAEYGVALHGVDGDRHLGRLAADARVALDIIHAGGVPFGWRGLDSAPPGLGMPQAMTARNLARFSGGSFFAHRFPNASMDVDAIDATTRFEYLLGYAPANTDWNGKYRHVVVKVTRPGLRVMHRDGYYARADGGSGGSRDLVVFGRVASAAAAGRPIRDLGVRADRALARVAASGGELQLTLQIDLSRVAFEARDGASQAKLEIAVFCAGRGDEPAGEWWQTVGLTFSADRLAEAKKDGVIHLVRMPIDAAPRRARVVVYDYGSDLVGTADADVTVAR
jgi:VWFA-related protein